MTNAKTVNGIKNSRKEHIEYWIILAFPMIQLILFYFVVNFNSVLLAFKEYDGNVMNWVGFKNFGRIFGELSTLPVMGYAVGNSFFILAINLVVGISTGLFFSYYIYKARFASGFFKVIFYMPSIISSVVLVFIFRYMADQFVPMLLNRIFGTQMGGFLSATNESMIFPTIIFYSLWMSFGTPIMLYVGAMKDIDESVIEAGQVDGVTPFREFIYIVFPQVFPTFIIFVTTTIAALFVNQLNLFTFYHVAADIKHQTIGYYLYVKVLKSTGYADYPYCAAFGLLNTFVTGVILFAVRKLLNRINPMRDAV